MKPCEFDWMSLTALQINEISIIQRIKREKKNIFLYSWSELKWKIFEAKVIKIPSNKMWVSGIIKNSFVVQRSAVHFVFAIVWHSIKEPRRNWADINLLFLRAVYLLTTHELPPHVSACLCVCVFVLCNMNAIQNSFIHLNGRHSSSNTEREKKTHVQKEDNTRCECF